MSQKLGGIGDLEIFVRILNKLDLLGSVHVPH